MLTPIHKDQLQQKLKQDIKDSAIKHIEEKAEVKDESPQTLENFIYGNVIINQ